MTNKAIKKKENQRERNNSKEGKVWGLQEEETDKEQKGEKE